MKTLRFSLVLGLVMSVASVSFSQIPNLRAQIKKKRSPYEQVDFEGLMRRYMAKPSSSTQTMEGIYSVTCVVTKRYKGFLSSHEKEKTVLRKDNYAKVAIMKDWAGSNHEYIELSLDAKLQSQYPIVGEFNSLSEGQGYIYKHTEPKGKIVSFTFSNSQDDMIEGVLYETHRSKTITYKMTYLKVFPKGNDQLTANH